MLRKNTIDDVVLALAAAPTDPRTGNKVLYSVDWVADKDSMIGQVNPDWVRRELDWFNSGSDKLDDMEGPVPALFQACAGEDGRVNSAYGHILFGESEMLPPAPTLFERVVYTFFREGPATRHAVAIISDRDIHNLARYNGRNDFICTNALNFMIDADNRLHIIAQMRSMDAVFGYRADYSMWDSLMTYLLTHFALDFPLVTRGDITFQVANLHVYPRHFELLADTAADIEERIDRRVWQYVNGDTRTEEQETHAKEPAGTGEALDDPGFTGTGLLLDSLAQQNKDGLRFQDQTPDDRLTEADTEEDMDLDDLDGISPHEDPKHWSNDKPMHTDPWSDR